MQAPDGTDALINSKKGVGMILGICAVFIAGVVAACAGSAGIAVLPYVVGGITAITGAHQISQGAHDVSKALGQANNQTQSTAPTSGVVQNS